MQEPAGEPDEFALKALQFHHYTARLVIWLALIIGGGLSALFVREWWHYLIAVVGYLLLAKCATEFYEMCLDTWWRLYGPPDDDGDEDDEPKPPPHWPYVHTHPRVDEKA